MNQIYRMGTTIKASLPSEKSWAMMADVSEAYGEPQDYESWEDVYRVWNEELDKAAAEGVTTPTFLIGGQSGAGKSTVSEGFRDFLIRQGKDAVVIHTNELFKRISLKEFGIFVKNGFSLLISRNRINFLDYAIARSERAAVIKNVIDQVKVNNGQALTFFFAWAC